MLSLASLLRSNRGHCLRATKKLLAWRSWAILCSAGKLTVFGGDFHFFTFFDEERDSDFQTRLEPGWLCGTARRVASNGGLGGGNVELNEDWQL
jgi:hypothetical protein